MKAPDQYNLPLKSIGEGARIFEFELDQDFFKSFENDLLGECSIVQKVEVTRRPDFLILSFSHEGFLKADCDRCLEKIRIPISGEKQFILKFVDQEQEDEEEVIYLLRDEDHFDLAPLINELTTLSIPIVKVYDCEKDPDAPCNPEVLRYLDSHEEPSEGRSQIWEQLKDLKLED
ncbi:MAG: DUF177 domain-containing protein [Saprospiraceae bacterium]|nr:DUF177 domain-containing protein [Saprospiraceae bacterium]